jgi:hypothetical protein
VRIDVFLEFWVGAKQAEIGGLRGENQRNRDIGVARECGKAHTA